METRLLSTAHEVGEEILLSSLCLAEHPRSLTIVSKTFSQIVFILHPWQGFHQRRFGRGVLPPVSYSEGSPVLRVPLPPICASATMSGTAGICHSYSEIPPPPPQALSSPPVMLCCAECSPGFALFLEILGSTWIWKIKIQALKVLEF